MAGQGGEASGSRPSEHLVREQIASRIAVPPYLTEQGGLEYAAWVLERADACGRELDLMAVEARAEGRRPEHTATTVGDARRRLEAARRGEVRREILAELAARREVEREAERKELEAELAARREGSRRRDRLRRHWSLILTTFGGAGLATLGIAGPWMPLVLGGSLVLLLGGAALILAAGE